MHEHHRLRLALLWFSIAWSTLTVLMIALSHIIANAWPRPLSIVDVRDSLVVALVLAPGLIATMVDLALGQWSKDGRRAEKT